MKPGRAARAERLAGYFGLQLGFARRMAALTGAPLAEAVSRCTNLHRRLGLGDIDRVAPRPAWAEFTARLVALPRPDDQLAFTLEAFLAAPEETLPAHQIPFGSFACEAPNPAGVVRMHFNNLDPDDDEAAGPLARANIPARIAELTAIFAHVRATWPQARQVAGASWLYQIEAYRRLFPPAYAASRRPPAQAPRLCGTSSWGQFLDHRGAFKPDLGARLTAALPTLDPAAPWRCFPLPVLAATAPIEAFYAFYRV